MGHPLLIYQNFFVVKSYLPKPALVLDRKSTRLNSSHVRISYAVFCLKKKISVLCVKLRFRLSSALRSLLAPRAPCVGLPLLVCGESFVVFFFWVAVHSLLVLSSTILV